MPITFFRADISNLDDLVEQRIVFMKDAADDLDAEFEAAMRTDLRCYYAEAVPTEECIYWFAKDGEKIVGGGGMARRRYAPGRMLRDGVSYYVFNIYTDPAYRKQGIAREIMHRLMAEGRRLGVARLELHASEAGRPLYEKLGFRPPDHAYLYLEWPVE